MEQNPQKSTLESKLFKIPIEEYEQDMEEESAKGKKKEILDLFTYYNKLSSEDEYNEIKDRLHEACINGDLEIIKIYLSKRIETKDLVFKIDETNRTASLFKVKNEYVEELIIPRTVQHEFTEYIITSISGFCKLIKILKFVENSEVKTVFQKVFPSAARIKEIYFPASLKELKDGWCYETNKLTKIIISPNNGQFKVIDNKYLVGKSDENKDEFDILLFGFRNIKEISIPSNIKTISSYAFECCKKLIQVEIQPNSNLQTIGSHAFSFSKIKKIFIPPNVSKIREFTFDHCSNLKIVEIQPNSNLQIIESNAFSFSKIKNFFVPSKVSKICKSAFNYCQYLAKFEIPQDSNLQIIESDTFSSSRIKEIYFPASLKELKDGWCYKAYELTKIIISPNNGQFKVIDNKYLVGKSDENKDEFDILLFGFRNIKEISIPSNIKTISSYAFECCQDLTKVEIQSNSNLQTIESGAFSCSKIKEIFIPSNVSKICVNAFNYCQYLTKVEIPPNSDLQKIESGAFEFSKIKEFFIPSKVSIICESAFYHCSNLTKIKIPSNSNLQTIESGAFAYSKIKEFFIPSKVSKIWKRAFNDCKNIQIIEISEESKLESFPLSAFSCYSNFIIMIPQSIKNIIQIK